MSFKIIFIYKGLPVQTSSIGICKSTHIIRCIRTIRIKYMILMIKFNHIFESKITCHHKSNQFCIFIRPTKILTKTLLIFRCTNILNPCNLTKVIQLISTPFKIKQSIIKFIAINMINLIFIFMTIFINISPTRIFRMINIPHCKMRTYSTSCFLSCLAESLIKANHRIAFWLHGCSLKFFTVERNAIFGKISID